MSISFTCPHCGKTTDVAEQYVGQSGPCVGCGKIVTVPFPAGGSPVDGPMPRTGLSSRATCLVVGLACAVVGLTVIGILLALLLPAVQAAREAARRVQCTNQLKQIGLAMHNYAQVNGCFPPAYIADKNGKPMHSWRVLILPYMEQDALYKQYRFDEPWDGPHNRTLADEMPMVFDCPSVHADTPREISCYAMIVGPHAISDGSTSRTFKDIKDGTSNTIMVAEAAGAHIPWLEPRDLNAETMSYEIDDNHRPDRDIRSNAISSQHAGGANVAFCDGSVRYLPDDTPPETLKAMTTIDGGEKLPKDFSP